MEYLAKGKRGLVYKGTLEGKDIVIKKNNPKTSSIGHLKHEYNVLKEVNLLGIGPKVIDFKDEKLTMEYISGELIIDYMRRVSRKEVVNILKQILDQLRTLDKSRINKSELTYPYKHIIVRKQKPVLIDFERARKTEKPSNVTQFCQFVCSSGMGKLFIDKGLNIDKQRILESAKNYKKKYNDFNYKKIIELLK